MIFIIFRLGSIVTVVISINIIVIVVVVVDVAVIVMGTFIMRSSWALLDSLAALWWRLGPLVRAS